MFVMEVKLSIVVEVIFVKGVMSAIMVVAATFCQLSGSRTQSNRKVKSKAQEMVIRQKRCSRRKAWWMERMRPYSFMM